MSLSFSDAVKAKQLREYFNRHSRIYIVVDATQDEVIVPESLRGDPALRLVLNVRMPQQIKIEDDRLDSDFSFSGQIFSCRIPMHTIWAAYLPEGDLEQGIIWDDSVPEMIKTIVQAVRSNISDEGTDGDVQILMDNKAKPETNRHQADEDTADKNKTDENKAPETSTISVIEGGGGTNKKDHSKARKTSHLRVVK